MSRVLLDTHVLLWVLTDDDRLGLAARSTLDDASQVLASTASLWELSIKHSIGKFPDPAPLVPAIERSGLRLIPIEPAHVLGVRASPLEHRDPFDRVLLAQAEAESAVLMTADGRILASPAAGVVDARV